MFQPCCTLASPGRSSHTQELAPEIWIQLGWGKPSIILKPVGGSFGGLAQAKAGTTPLFMDL